MAQPFEISGAHKRTEQGNNDWYYGGQGMAWEDRASALAGVPSVIRPGKTVGIIENGRIVEYIWHPEDITDNGLVKKTADTDMTVRILANDIFSSNDFNDFNLPGLYIVEGAYTNGPSTGTTINGILEVQKRDASGVIRLVQIYTHTVLAETNTGKQFSRIKGDSTWSPWNTELNSDSKASIAEVDAGIENTKFITALTIEGSKYLDRTFSKISGTTSGSSTVYTANLTPAIVGYITNQPFLVTVHTTSGASPTINFNGQGAKAWLRMDGSAIQAGDLVAGVRYLNVYDGTAVRMLTPIINENVRNQNSLQQSANFWILTGRFDTGVGVGTAPSAAAWLTMAANTAAKGSYLMTQSTTDYTGTINGMFWNNGGELKFLDNAIVNRVFKWYNNELGKSDGNYVVTLNQYGDASANIKVTERWVYDTDVLAAIVSATWSSDRATITPANSKKMYKGQRHDDGTYSYEAIDDNKLKRW